MTPNLHTQTPYYWGKATAKHLYGEPDCTYVPLGLCYDITVNDGTEHWQLLGMQQLLYGPEELAAHTN